jgi:hypothetical protein
VVSYPAGLFEKALPLGAGIVDKDDSNGRKSECLWTKEEHV